MNTNRIYRQENEIENKNNNNDESSLNTNIDEYSVDELLNLFNLDDNPSLFQINTIANSAITQLKTSGSGSGSNNSIENRGGYDKNILYFLENARDKLLDIFSNGTNSYYVNDSNHSNNSNDIMNKNRNINKLQRDFNNEDEHLKHNKNSGMNLQYEDTRQLKQEEEGNRKRIESRYSFVNGDGNGNSKGNMEHNLNEWHRNEYLPQRDPTQDAKVTNRKQQIETWNENGQYPMKQNMLGINQSIQIPVSQDTLNPTLRNLNTRIVNLDSQFRQNILPFYPHDPDSLTSSTNYTCELSDTLTKVLSMLLYSVQIPNTWYRFSEEQGNTCFKLMYNSITYYFNLPSGNYDVSSIVVALNDDTNWNPSPKPSGLEWQFNQTTSKLSFTTGNLSESIFYFYDMSGSIQCNGGKPCFETMEINKNLGWSLGYRPEMYTNSNKQSQFLSFIKVYPPNSTNVLDSVIDLTGPKYFSIILDDFNKNRQNKGLVNIALIENTKLNLPPYYSSDLTIDCCGNKVQVSSGKYKKITQAQSYSINQIIQNRKNNLQKTNRLISSDILAILPIDINLNTRTQPYTVFGANLLFNERRYYGPVNINKLKIRLVDDRGFTVNLNGADWNMSLLVNELYQY